MASGVASRQTYGLAKGRATFVIVGSILGAAAVTPAADTCWPRSARTCSCAQCCRARSQPTLASELVARRLRVASLCRLRRAVIATAAAQDQSQVRFLFLNLGAARCSRIKWLLLQPPSSITLQQPCTLRCRNHRQPPPPEERDVVPPRRVSERWLLRLKGRADIHLFATEISLQTRAAAPSALDVAMESVIQASQREERERRGRDLERCMTSPGHYRRPDCVAMTAATTFAQLIHLHTSNSGKS